MDGRLDPTHDRVLLTRKELRALAELEQSLTEHGDDDTAHVEQHDHTAREEQASRVRWVSWTPWCAPIAWLLLIVGLFISPIVAVAGAFLVAIASGATWRAFGRGRAHPEPE